MPSKIDVPRFTFRSKVLNPKKLRAELDEGQVAGEAEIMIAVFDVPDTHVAFGNSRKQVIEKGAFRSWIDGTDLEADPLPGFVDHGDATIFGQHLARLKIGKATGAEETTDGLVVSTQYNLQKTVGREAFSDLAFDPTGVQFSFGWDTSPEKERIEVKDKVEHVVELWPTEWSQVAFGAQRLAHLVEARAAAGSMRAKSLEALPRSIRNAWYAQMPDIRQAFGEWAYVEDIFGESSTDDKGTLIAGLDNGRFKRVTWEVLEDNDFRFGLDDAEDVEVSWVSSGNGRTRGDKDAMREAIAETKAACVVEDGNSEVAAFYRSIFGPTDAGTGATDDGWLKVATGAE